MARHESEHIRSWRAQLSAGAADAPTTNDAIMDCSTDLELSIQSLCSGGFRSATPLKGTKREKSQGERWFSFDSSGQMYFVEREDSEFSFDGDSFCSVCSDDECPSIDSSPVTARCSPRVGTRSETARHVRQNSQSSTGTVDMFEGDSFHVYEDSRRPEGLALAHNMDVEKTNRGPGFLPPLSEDEPMDLETPDPSYIRDTKIPIRGWFQSCRACGSWTGAALNVQNTEVPMCKRCQKKWDLVACGHDVPLYNQDGNSDLLKQHVQHKLETCLQGDTSLSRRKAICDEALLEVHQAWIVHNGEE